MFVLGLVLGLLIGGSVGLLGLFLQNKDKDINK